jgi:dienelactone hydrolase
MSRFRLAAVISFAAWLSWSAALVCPAQEKVSGPPLAGTQPLTMEGDIAVQMIAGIDKFLLREIDLSVERREMFWNRDFSSPEAYNKSIEPNRQRLKKILGVVDERVPFDAPELMNTTKQSALVGRGKQYEIFAVRWPAVRQVQGEGLLLVPKGEKIADIIAIPDADQTPEQICGLADGVPAESQFARRLAENGCRVLVPTLINREMAKRNAPGLPGRANLTNREYVYRPSFELGRHIIGYELQKVLAGVDWFANELGSKAQELIKSQAPPTSQAGPDRKAHPISVIGYGEGGMLAFYAAAIDPRIDNVSVCGYFQPRERVWEQPIDRNVFGLLERFGDAELIYLARRYNFFAEDRGYPELKLPSEGGAPAVLRKPTEPGFKSEIYRTINPKDAFTAPDSVVGKDPDTAPFASEYALAKLGLDRIANAGSPPTVVTKLNQSARQQRQIEELVRDTQYLLAESPYVRQQFMKRLYDTKTVEEYEKVADEYREFFATDVIGRFDYPLEKPNPKSRKSYESDKWTGYEVTLDVFPDVFAYGILCLPRDLQEGEKRPVVVCQHGLEGRPQDVIGEQRQEVYSAFAGKLAERGFITFAPQNIYIGKDTFRTLQRKANPLGKTLFSIMVPQHQQICNWLKALPFVDDQRIAFYGLSYGGKSAMRIPSQVKDYCLSICSADFNDWVDRNAQTRSPYSYVWSIEYEIFEFDLGSTFNYSDMAALIAPRPFMVERGHLDTVATDDRVASEYAKVQRLYNVQLKLPDRCQIEWFVGPHKINGVGTFDFLHKHLQWPKPQGSE